MLSLVLMVSAFSRVHGPLRSLLSVACLHLVFPSRTLLLVVSTSLCHIRDNSEHHRKLTGGGDRVLSPCLASRGRSSSASLHSGASHPGCGEQRFLGSAVLPCPAALAGPCMHLSILGERSCLGEPPESFTVTSTSARSAAGPLLPVYGGRWEVTANNQMPCPLTAHQRHSCPMLCFSS